MVFNSFSGQLPVRAQSPDLLWRNRAAACLQNRTPDPHLNMSMFGGNRGPNNEISTDVSIIRIPPHHYIHVLDQNTNIARVEIGPLTYIRQDNERVLFSPVRMIVVPPRHYCVVSNPVARDDNNEVLFDQSGQAKLRHADLEIRLTQDPFPLYPGEEIQMDVTPLQIVYPDTALRLQALLDFEEEGLKRIAGDEWLFEGPGTYIPRKEVVVLETIKATVIRENQAIRLRARKEGKDRGGVQRVTGEEWLVSKVGAYLPGAHEEVLDIVNAFILTDKKALHVRALRPFKDAGGRERRTGEEWLVTMADREAHIPSVAEEVVGVVDVTTLSSRQYCVILDPVGADGKPQLGQKKVVKGERSFFLQPGEQLENGIQDVYVLSEEEGLVLRAVEAFNDSEPEEEEEEEDPEEEGRSKRAKRGSVLRRPGDRWMLRGPIEYVPPASVEVVLTQRAIPLDENEGIYVRHIKTGKVRAVIGHTYMLNQDEELWEKELPTNVEALLASRSDPLADRSIRHGGGDGQPRDKTRVVTFRVPHNAAVQIYDYREKKARVVFGPELVMLGPDEQFTVLSLSGDKPKRANVIKAICLLLGPDFCTDIITIETADHARLQLQLAYNWHFDVKIPADPAAAAALFSVPDFVGDACKAIASRIRGAVASVQFDDFHKNSNRIICSAVFGFDEKLAVRPDLRFGQNNLVISSVDIQSVEPVDQRTRDALQKSVQLAIEITTNSQEAAARHEAERLEQEARGKLERQRITDQAEAERARKELLELEALSASVESTGAAKAEAQSQAEAARIRGEAAVNEATLKAEAQRIEAEAELQRLSKARDQELNYKRELDRLEVEKQERLAQIESDRFKKQMESLGTDTLMEIARAGPELQLKMLQALGLKSTLITDGSSPINLFTTANGLLGALPGQAQ
ncbi:major vault protein [Nothobranchius furzeri]|uniref:Major vault protein n=2 Tax=Nothobranchius TaxID=28779 RepID=A0A9D2YWY2_NOTFU|nr:major vault protein [Nothobranchius furzeri]KAF7227582.1 major vault protein [Nothobranchius furzeri]